MRIRVESVLAIEGVNFLISRADGNILQKLLQTEEKVLLQLWAGRGASILSH
jgi:hypothetical protein